MTAPSPELSAPPRRHGRGGADNYDRDGVFVRGNASVEEVAALLAVFAARPAAVPDAYSRWRQGRLAALHTARA